ncbi:MAG: hypothetical protein R3E48_03965 [Burkholderiaceae bacterium]
MRTILCTLGLLPGLAVAQVSVETARVLSNRATGFAFHTSAVSPAATRTSQDPALTFGLAAVAAARRGLHARGGGTGLRIGALQLARGRADPRAAAAPSRSR